MITQNKATTYSYYGKKIGTLTLSLSLADGITYPLDTVATNGLNTSVKTAIKNRIYSPLVNAPNTLQGIRNVYSGWTASLGFRVIGRTFPLFLSETGCLLKINSEDTPSSSYGKGLINGITGTGLFLGIGGNYLNHTYIQKQLHPDAKVPLTFRNWNKGISSALFRTGGLLGGVLASKHAVQALNLPQIESKFAETVGATTSGIVSGVGQLANIKQIKHDLPLLIAIKQSLQDCMTPSKQLALGVRGITHGIGFTLIFSFTSLFENALSNLD